MDSPKVVLCALEAAETVQSHSRLSAGARRAGVACLATGGVWQRLVATGWWRLAGSPQAAEAMSLVWSRNQSLIALTARYAQLNQYRKPPDTMSTSGGVGGRGL